MHKYYNKTYKKSKLKILKLDSVIYFQAIMRFFIYVN